MKGVSEVIAIILILMIVISMAGLAYMFLSDTMSGATSAASSSVSSTTSGILTSFVIESVDAAKVYVRNTGQTVLTNLTVYVNDEPAVYNVTPSTLAAGEVGTVTIYSFIPDGGTVKVVSPSGFSTTKTAEPCKKAVGCWKFDEGSGAMAYDSSPYGNHGTLTNMNTTGNATSGWAVGRYGNALLFDGVNDHVDAGNSSIFNLTDNFTVEAWFKASSSQLTEWAPIVAKNSIATPRNSFELFILSSNNVTVSLFRNGVKVGGTSSPIAPGNFYHVVFTVSYPKLSMWVNGINATPAAMTNYVGANIQPITIGRQNDLYFNGTIDEVRIYDRAIY